MGLPGLPRRLRRQGADLPFHGWLVDAYRESPPEVAAILSGVVSKAAVYGLLRIVIEKFPEPVDDFQVTILALAAIGLVDGSLLAFRAPDIRSVTAYSSMAQMGLIVLGLFSLNDLGQSGAIVQSVAHGLVSATLFLLAGMVETRTGTARPPCSAAWREADPPWRRC